MLQPTEAKAIIEFLDRVAVQGHRERGVMNLVVGKLDLIANPPPLVKVPDGDTTDD